jgi:Domain of unknown function (DUF2828)
MSSSPRIAFPLDEISSLPTIQELVEDLVHRSRSEYSYSVRDDSESDFEDIEVCSSETASDVLPLSDGISELGLRGHDEPQVDLATTGHEMKPLLDLFYAINDQDTPANIREKLWAAWGVDALRTLKLIFFMRNKCIKRPEAFHKAAQWLMACHPKTFFASISHWSRLGCWKDLLDTLVYNRLSIVGQY